MLCRNYAVQDCNRFLLPSFMNIMISILTHYRNVALEYIQYYIIWHKSIDFKSKRSWDFPAFFRDQKFDLRLGFFFPWDTHQPIRVCCTCDLTLRRQRGKRRSKRRERRLIKSTDTGERNVDIIRNIRDALKVIRFHIRASTAERSVAVVARTGRGPKGTGREGGYMVDGEGWRRSALSGCQGPLPWPLFPLCRVFSGFNHPLASSVEAMAATAMSPAYWQSRNWTSGTLHLRVHVNSVARESRSRLLAPCSFFLYTLPNACYVHL